MRIQHLAPLLLAAAISAQQLPPYELPPDVAAAIRAKAHREPFVLLQQVAGADRDLREVAEQLWDTLDARERVALVRAGLRADGDIAVGAAAKAHEGWVLDRAECKRAVAVGLPRCNEVHTPFDVGEFFDLMDADDVTRLLTNPGPMPHDLPTFLGALHQRFGPEHFAAIEQIAHGDDLLLRQDARRFLGVVKLERQRYANFLLSLPDHDEPPEGIDPVYDPVPFQPRAFSLRPAGEGYAPLLAALLERLASGPAVLTGGDATFAWRWAVEATPAEVDRPLLQRLATSDQDALRRVACDGLVRLGGEHVDALLHTITANVDPKGCAHWLALAALVQRGDADARALLASEAAREPLAMALAWQHDRAAATAGIVSAMQADPVAGKAAMKHVLEARDQAEWWGMPLPGFDAALVAAAEGAELDAERLGMLLEAPWLRSAKLAARAIAAMQPADLEHLPLAVLEVADAPALAARLHELLRGDVPAPQSKDALHEALFALASLGPTALGDLAQQARLWQLVQSWPDAAERTQLAIRLAANGHAAVVAAARAALARTTWQADTEASDVLAVAMAAAGVDADLCLQFASRFIDTAMTNIPAVAVAMVPALQRGDGDAAMTALVGFGPDLVGELRGLHTCRAPAVRAYLERLRDERERGSYRWAIGELARAGDQAARTEIEQVISRRLYHWIDDMDTDVLTDGDSLARVPLLLTQVDANCCTFAVIGTALEGVFELDAFTPELGLQPRPDHVRAAWARAKDHLRWSRIARRWLIWPG